MPPRSSPSHRLSLLGCVLAGVASLLLPACGGGGNATAERTDAPQAARQVKVGVGAGEPCPAEVGAFVGSLDGLRKQLAVGLSYDQYTARVKALHARYERLPIQRLGLGCLASSGTPAETALNKYIDAANAWGECLADASCTTATIEPVLQQRWRVASRMSP